MTTTRREWLMIAAALGVAHVSAAGAEAQSQAAPAAIGPSDGELVYVGRDPVRIKISPQGERGRFAMITQDVSPGTTIPVHLHEREDEVIFIQSGRGEATLGPEKVPLEAGSTLYVPQGTWHGGRNTGQDVLRWIAFYSPSGFEGYFREIGRRWPDAPPRMLSMQERRALDERFGIRYP
ncbi:MAG TPA: cupin domain-containing protein [Vicinamibacterales bacterium]|nr:cupin domain-containing protein [Vicinamibacterales bacterium]